ncbi:MAG: PAS domain-containing protein [Alphaproteobacteria bacterium]|nr:PAS domain-containing protein [Alphaproteobacteria bacterium]MCW5740299.1 PAS domain-containing protein [Alphaproteobacteria bacterium]
MSELEALIAEAISSGRYRDAAEAAGHLARLLKGGGVGLDSESELSRLIDGIGEGFYALDSAFRIVRYNEAASRHFGLPAEAVLGRVLWDVFPSATDTELGKLFRRTMASRATVISETQSVLIYGRWLAYRLFPLGEGMGVVFRDVTDRKTVEEDRELLINELNHRVKNTLATVQSMARQTLTGRGVPLAVQRGFEARLQALGNVHTLLTERNWEGAGLREVIEVSLRPYGVADRARFALEGPDFRLRPKSAVALSLALNELGTNAAKYGALSADSGRVALAWRIAGEGFGLRWQESGGPPVRPPARRGFGTRLIERGLAAELRGRVKIEYRTEGVVCTIEAPLDSLREEGSA